MECPFDLPVLEESQRSEPLIEKYEVALLMLLGFAGLSVLIGAGYNLLRHYVFRDKHKFDVVFDAGGRVSLSLTTVTATSQLMWPADFLQSPTIASKVGIGGSLWYTMAIVIPILMFAVLCIQLKSRAPGAKTYAQIAYARFGKPAHILLCVVALFTNLVIVANLTLAGQTAVQVLAKDSSNEFVCLILAVLFGSYCLIGGLGTTFYISYFNTALIFITTSIFILKTTYLATPEVHNVTSFSVMYDAMSCLKGPDGNAADSFLTFRSESGIINGVVVLFMTIAIVFCDNANWQSKIAAKPAEGVIGFFLAGFLWFAIPTSISYMTTLVYKTMSFREGTNLLTAEEIDAGYITPYVVQSLLGKEGCFVLLTLLTMTLMSTGSGEVMSASSILVYDIYKIYIRPFRKGVSPTDCVLCGKSKLMLKDKGKMCNCASATDCLKCREDVQTRLQGKLQPGQQYKCQIHGKYRHYEDELQEVKAWCMIWVVIAIIPIGLVIIESGMNLNWTFMAAQVFVSPFIAPLFLTIAWSGATGAGVVSGGLVGLVAAVVGLVVYGSTLEDGLSNFYTNTSNEYSIITGLGAGFVFSFAVAIIVSLFSKRTNCWKPVAKNGSYSSNAETYPHELQMPDMEYEWQKTMSIDNPLNPFITLYKHQLEKIGIVGKHVTTNDMSRIFRKAKILSMVAALLSFAIFLVVIPALALSQNVLTEGQMTTWISGCQMWCLIATVLVVVIPPVQEVWQIYRQIKANKSKTLASYTDVSIVTKF